MENYKFSKDYCNKLIKHFSENETMERFEDKDIPKGGYYQSSRSYQRFIIWDNSVPDKYKWLWKDVDTLIKRNLGNNYYLSLWLIVLKYSKGDYFEKHQDRPTQDDGRCLSGGVQLSDKNDFEGADYVVKDEVMEFVRGKLFTHKLTDEHEITKTKKGTRWSLHFGINKLKTPL